MDISPFSSKAVTTSLNREFPFDAESNERSVLIPREAYLINAILEGPIDHIPLNDPHKCARRVIETLCTLASLGANATYVPISLQLPAGLFFATGNFLAFVNLDFWAFTAIFNELLGPKREYEQLLLNQQATGKIYKTALVTAALVIALLSQVPLALPALDYDRPYEIQAVVILLVAGSFIPTRSLQISFDKSLQMRKYILRETDKKLESARSEVISLVGQYRENFRQSNRQSQLALFDALSQITHLERGDQLNSYLSQVLHPAESTSNPNKFCKYSSFVLGFCLTASLQVALTMYTWDKTKTYITDNDYAASGFVATVIGASLYLTGRSIIGTAQRIAQSTIDLLTGRRDRTLAEQIRPKLTFTLKLIGLLLNLGTLGPGIVIWGGFYDDEKERLYFQTTICAAYFLLVSTATLDVLDSSIQDFIQWKGSPEDQSIIQLYTDLQKLEKLFEQSSLLDFSLFLTQSSENIKGMLLEKVGLSIEELRAYMAQNGVS